MSLVLEIFLNNLPHTPIFAGLFTNVKNSSFLRGQLLAGNSEFEYAFINADAIMSTTHVLAAVHRALLDPAYGRLKSRNVHSEIVFNLSPNNNIGESFRRFGVTDETTNLIAIKIGNLAEGESRITQDTVSTHLAANVQATSLPFSDDALSTLSNINTVRKLYKLGGTGATSKSNGPTPIDGASAHPLEWQIASLERAEIETTVLGMMALKGS